MSNLKKKVKLVKWFCATCGSVNTIPKPFWERLTDNGESFFCYNGHSNYFPQTKKINE